MQLRKQSGALGADAGYNIDTVLPENGKTALCKGLGDHDSRYFFLRTHVKQPYFPAFAKSLRGALGGLSKGRSRGQR
ncbi:MAG: hypothetical protein NVSMB31_03970 [Vulcanimicrobiaceae bacterium]